MNKQEFLDHPNVEINFWILLKSLNESIDDGAFEALNDKAMVLIKASHLRIRADNQRLFLYVDESQPHMLN